MEKIGFIGLGIMGKPIAKNLLKAGYNLNVLDINLNAVEELVKEGATPNKSPKQVAEDSDVAITVLPDSPEVEQVVLEPGGVIEGISSGMLFIDMSTIAPATSRKVYNALKEKDAECLDAPVSGGEIGAIEATLSIMVGGLEDTFQRALPIFDILGKNIVLIGEAGAGQVAKVAEDGKVLNDDVIRSFDNAYHSEGGIAVLKGNIASSSIVKQTAVKKEMQVHSGPAKVFYTEKDLIDSIAAKKIDEGDVVVLPYQGPAGAPGMPEMLTPTDAIKGAGYSTVALITDGRFSGATTGPCIGHVEMEAYNSGTIGVIRDGDIIEIDIPNRKLNVKISKTEIKGRLKNLQIRKRKLTPLLASYRKQFIGKNCYGR
jgi:6-phosphogluconate dehydrogenase (decarboxylating)